MLLPAWWGAMRCGRCRRVTVRRAENNFRLVVALSARDDGQISRARHVCCPTGLLADAEVWSRFEYTDTCSGRPVAIPIEPLVGLLRHPTAHRCAIGFGV